MPTIKQLREICSKKDKRPFYEVHFMREASFYLTKFVLLFPITPNHITFIATVLGIISSACFMYGNYYSNIIGALVFQAWYIFDMIDGNIARFKKLSSSKGLWYDRIMHFVVEPLLLLGIGIGIFRNTNNYYFLLAGFILFYCTIFFRVTVSEKYRVYYEHSLFKKNTYVSLKSKKKSNISFKAKVLLLLKHIFDAIGFTARHPFMMNIILMLSIFSLLHLFLIVYIFIFPLIAIGNLVYESKIRFDMKE